LVTQALAAGQIDVADTDAEGVLNAAAAGFPLLAVSAPAQHLSYLVMVQPEIKSFKDLAGKPFAISRPGALSQYLMFPALDRDGVARNAVSWVPIGGPSERRLALVNNRVKGALLHLDYALVAQRDSKVVALDRVVRTNPDYPHEVLVVRREIAEKNPAAVTAVTRSIIEACRFMVSHRERTIELYRKYTGETDMALANAAYDALLAIHGYGVNGGLTRKGLEDVAKLAAENGARTIPLEAWADLRFQEEALRQIGSVPE
jgi:ABC-type nitrate/sulfonate/bicarbonate transport system substrate-binding protein